MRDYDPPLSLDGGKDGLEFIRKIAKDFGRLSNEGAHCLCQIGPSQASMSDLIFRDAGFRDIEIKGNYFGAPCCIVVKKTIRRCAGRCLLKKLKEVFHSNRNNMVKI
jgi:release factor glutamine methyltransferase